MPDPIVPVKFTFKTIFLALVPVPEVPTVRAVGYLLYTESGVAITALVTPKLAPKMLTSSYGDTVGRAPRVAGCRYVAVLVTA